MNRRPASPSSGAAASPSSGAAVPSTRPAPARSGAGTGRAGLAAALSAALSLAACASSGEKALSVETYVHNAQTYVDGGHHDQALQQWRRALELDPGSQKALLGEAFALLALGQGELPSSGAYIQEAERAFAQLEARGFGENGWKVDLGRGMTAWRLAELWDRKTGLRIRTADGDDPVNRASIEEARGQRERHREIARKAFLAVLEDGNQPMAKDNLVALWHLATLSALRAEAAADYDAALGYFRRFEEQIEKSKRLWQEGAKREPSLAATFERKLMGAKSQEVELRDVIANIHFKRRDHAASIAELDKVLAIDAYRPTAYFNRGRNREELGQHGLAADDYRQFIALTDLPPDAPQVLEATERMKACLEAGSNP